ncbi:MAG: carboxylating nicotinate-nucleotide diphosphorylase [Ilumatobacteraceae bacterium]|jgi:nicotinate-nucleotide pyrophosphorylase (carboxylating)|nr:carboxylating nicotinate-nucleotide diphosphorylase [Ilumatobacteraceae bacterium]
MSSALRERLSDAGLDAAHVEDLVRRTVEEDLAGGEDVTTTSTVPVGQRSIASFTTRARGSIAGLDLAAAAVEMVCGVGACTFTRVSNDGQRVSPGDVLATVEAPTRGLLTAERTALNFLCHLSGVATATATWVDAIAGTEAKVRDTRKTTPGLRSLEKYAVRCGGGHNHRMSLSDAALVKDNHIVAAGGVAEAFALVRQTAPDMVVEIEVDTLEQLHVALDAGADLVLLDNMAPSVMSEAVGISRQHTARTGRRVLLEASGGLTLANAKDVAATGVNFISVGALTHSSPILDIGLDVQTVQ